MKRLVILLCVLWLLAACGDKTKENESPLSPLTTPSTALITHTPPPPPSPLVSPTPSVSAAPTAAKPSPTPPVIVYGYQVINTYPHDPNAFTQGLVFADGKLYEGTGQRGSSSLRLVELASGQVLRSHKLAKPYFGEGIALVDDRIIQLTWQSNVGFVYDRDSFELLQEFSYPTEGWGITYDGQRLIMSDGTATLYFWHPETLEEIGRIQVYDDKGPVARLNELEYVQGLIYANVWQTDRIAQIDTQTGRVVAWIDLSGLLQNPSPSADVLNGIAYDAQNERLFVTGKLWPSLFEIRLVSHQ